MALVSFVGWTQPGFPMTSRHGRRIVSTSALLSCVATNLLVAVFLGYLIPTLRFGARAPGNFT
jgi:hypothetical protein